MRFMATASVACASVRDRAERHRAGGEALDDLLGRLDLVDRDRLGRIDLELEQAAQRHVAAALVVDELRVFLVGAPVVGARAVLQLGDRVGRPHVLFAAHAPGVFAAGVEHAGQHRVVAEGGLVHAHRFLGDLEHADALDPAGGAGEVLVDGVAVQADGLEQLRAAVAHVGRHAHLGHDLRQALADRLDVVVDRLVGATGRPAGRLCMRDQRFHRQVGVHGLGAVAGQHARSGALRAPMPVSTTRPAVVRRPSRTRCWWIADSASSAGIATCVAADARGR